MESGILAASAGIGLNISAASAKLGQLVIGVIAAVSYAFLGIIIAANTGVRYRISVVAILTVKSEGGDMVMLTVLAFGIQYVNEGLIAYSDSMSAVLIGKAILDLSIAVADIFKSAGLAKFSFYKMFNAVVIGI